MSIDLTQAKADVTVNMHTEANSAAMALEKTGTSKTITAAEWNSLVYMLAYLIEDSTFIAEALSDTIDAIGTYDGTESTLTDVIGAVRSDCENGIESVENTLNGLIADAYSGVLSDTIRALWDNGVSANKVAIPINSIVGLLQKELTAANTVSSNLTIRCNEFDNLIKANKTYIDSLEKAIGTDDAVESIKGRITTAESDIDKLETEIGYDTAKSTVKGRVTTLEGKMSVAESDIVKLETQTKIEFDSVKNVFYLSVAGNRVSDLDVITKGVITSAKYEAETNTIVVTFADGKTAEVILTDLVDEAIVDSILKERYDALITGTVKTEISNNAELKASVTTAQTSAETARSFANASGSSASAAQTAKTASETAKTAAETAKAGADVAKAAAETARQIAEEKADIATAAAETAVQAAESAQQSAGTANSVVSSLAPRVSAAEKRITNLEKGITPDPFVTDDTVAYQKTVPENALPFAAIERVGGMSYKSKNLANMLDFRKNYGVINADGSLTISVSWDLDCNATYTGKLKSGTYTITNLSEKTMYVMFSSSDYSNSVAVGGKRTFTYDGSSYLRFQFEIQTANVSTTYKIMLNEGATALPYEPYFEGIRHAAVTEVESKGVNYLRFEERTVASNGITFVGNADGTITVNGTATANAYFDFREVFSLDETDELYSYDGCPEGANASTYALQLYMANADGSTGRLLMDCYHNGVDFKEAYKNVKGFLVVRTGTTVNNLVFKPRIVKQSQLGTEFRKAFREIFPIPEAVQALDGYGWGISKEVNNHFSYADNGRVTCHKKVGGVDIGTLNWEKIDNTWFAAYVTAKAIGLSNLLCEKYPLGGVGFSGMPDKTITGSVEYRYVYVRDAEYTDTASFKAAMSGVMLYYELGTPEVTDITDLISPDNFIPVEGGGTITVVNEHELAAPSTILYMTKEETV